MKKDYQRILILSDSHSAEDRVRRLFSEQAAHFDLAVFLGDGLRDLDPDGVMGGIPVYAVKGNCDGFFGDYMNVPTERRLTVGAKNILLTHGHRFDVKYGLEKLALYAAQNGYDVALFGHTHEPIEKHVTVCLDNGEERRVALFNPGSIGAGYGGASFGTLTVRSGQLLFGHGKI